MALSFSAQEIIYNAFWSLGEGSMPYLSYREIRDYCNRLYDMAEASGHKYVTMHVDDSDIDKFMENDSHFIRGIDRIVCVHEVSPAEMFRMNSRFPTEIQSILEKLKAG